MFALIEQSYKQLQGTKRGAEPITPPEARGTFFPSGRGTQGQLNICLQMPPLN